MYTYIPLGLIAIFLGYILYLAFVKKDVKSKLKSVVLPGVFFIAVWAAIYYFILK